jgi:hypothetical protein
MAAGGAGGTGAGTGGGTAGGGGGDPAAACAQAGGTVQTVKCCATAGDFPNMCTVGACTCAPNSSVNTKVCQCPQSECFNGKTCVAM